MSDEKLVSPDEAREALATISDAQDKAYDAWVRRSLIPNLLIAGWGGLVGFGLNSRIVESLLGVRIFNGFLGALALFALMFLPAILLVSKHFRSPVIKHHLSLKTLLPGVVIGNVFVQVFPVEELIPDMPVAMIVSFASNFSIGFIAAPMLWLGRYYAFAAFAFCMCIVFIHIQVAAGEPRLLALTALSGLVLLPAAIWLILKDRQNEA
jgi:hypothetical protein